MIRCLVRTVLLLFLFCCENRQSEKLSFKRRIDSLVVSMRDFSGVILVADGGRPVYHKAFGYESFERNEKLDTNSVFELASVSKQFTAMIIMMLAEEGRLDIDDSILKYIPDLPYENITIRNLLNHTSGLPDYQEVMDQHWDKSKVAGNEDNIAYLIKYKPAKRFSPGDKYEYSNTGYMLLASIAEKASGQDFIALCRQKIFTPLQMRSTDIRSLSEKKALPNMAWGHILVKEKNKYVQADSFPSSNYSIWLGNRKGPGRISSTSTDLLKWDQALYGDSLISQTALQEGFQPAKLNNDSISNYGFGWIITKHSQAGEMIYHTGDNPGYKTHLIRFIDKKRTVIVLCNNAHEKYGELMTMLIKTAAE
jgi:CubicO group peptidase (beta-lactamase class C family)